MQDSAYTPNVRPLEPRPISQKKKCRLCGVEKPLYDFKEDRRMIDGKWHTCAQCEAGKARSKEPEPVEIPVVSAAVIEELLFEDEEDTEEPEPEAEPEQVPVEEVDAELPAGWSSMPTKRLEIASESLIGYGLGGNKSVRMLGSPPPPSHDQEHIAALQAKIRRLQKAERKIHRELSYARTELENHELKMRLAALERQNKEAGS